MTNWVHEGFQKKSEARFFQPSSNSFFRTKIFQVPKQSQGTQTVTHTQIVTAFMVARKCDYLEALQQIKYETFVVGNSMQDQIFYFLLKNTCEVLIRNDINMLLDQNVFVKLFPKWSAFQSPCLLPKSLYYPSQQKIC